jgi:AcrR family transcriptional regulator
MIVPSSSLTQPDEDTAAEPAGRGRAARVEAILDAAVELIGEVGYDRMSMDAIAGRARASKATMYRHWPGKAELVAEAFRCHSCAEVSCPPDTGSLRGDLLATVDALADGFAGEMGHRFTGLMMAMREDPALAELIRAQIDQDGRDITETLLRRAAGRGEPVVALDAAFVLSLAPAAVLTRLLLIGGPTGGDFRRQLVDQVLLPLLTGIPVTPSEPQSPSEPEESR